MTPARPDRFPATSEDLFAVLDALGVEHRTHEHPPAFTVEQANAHWGEIPGIHCKNLFLKDGKGKLWLVVAAADRRVDLKSLPERIGSARLSFGNPDLMLEVLGITPGSVTPFALINDRDRRVTVVLDADMIAQPLVNYHPLRNDATTTLSAAGLLAFLDWCGNARDVVRL